ncbi:MAG: glycosyltransferase family 4 protein [Promethearchaeota archaeon]|jgi:glycosyltransferase involved in cell wall biosynthesis
MKKLKIALVSLTISPDSQDGSAKFFSGIYNYLKKRGHDVKVLTGKWNLNLNDPNVSQIKILRKSYLWIPQFVLKVINFLRNADFDIIHGNGPKGTLPLLLYNKKNFISTIHDLGPIESSFSFIPIEKILINEVIKKANLITTCSEFTKQQIKKFFPKIELKKVHNLYSAIDSKFKPYPKKAEQLKENLELKGPVALYIGRIALYKDIENVIKAYKYAKKEIANLELVIGGTPDFYMKETYKRWKQKYKDVHFIGFIPEAELPIYYSMGDVFITYSYSSEGFGLTPIEAIACGTPAICSSIGAYSEVLQNNALFVPPKNPKFLARELINLIKDDEKREELLKHAQNFISKYSWNSVGKKLEEVYEKFLSI